MNWSKWSTLTPLTSCSKEGLARTLGGGQSFRWDFVDTPGDEHWQGSWSTYVSRLRIGDSGCMEFSTIESQEDVVHSSLIDYLQLSGDFLGILDALPWRSDPVLGKAMRAVEGLRLLKQPFGETLLCYLCSSNKQIVQIRQICSMLAERFGTSPCLGVYNLPTWETLSKVSLEELKDCKLGYRAKYIYNVAQFLKANPTWLGETERLSYMEARKRLISLSGVGEKVADCVLLFGAAKFESFPVDVWVERAMSRYYGLEGWSKEQVSHFGRQHFGKAAGVAQQYLFEAERLGKMSEF